MVLFGAGLGFAGSKSVPVLGLSTAFPLVDLLMMLLFIWFLIAMWILLLVFQRGARAVGQRDLEADKAAVAVTGNVGAALSALAKMAEHGAPALGATRTTLTTQDPLSSSRLVLRQAALQKLAPDVKIPPGPPPNLSGR